jgi:predicted small secreted protein
MAAPFFPPPLIGETTMWTKIIFCVATLLSLALTACNTVQGAGQDVSAAGNAVSREAQEHKTY